MLIMKTFNKKFTSEMKININYRYYHKILLEDNKNKFFKNFLIVID